MEAPDLQHFHTHARTCRYPDFVETPSGLQYKDFREGSGDAAVDGDMLVVDWDGYTIGYYGRPFEARNKVCRVCRGVGHDETTPA